MVHTWDIFCSVVDNFGDVGVCWRLARALAGERGQKVRLWVDDLASLQRLCHTIDADNAAQRVAGVEIRRWQSAGKAPWPAVEVADIVIEGFGVRLPPDYIEAMAGSARRPVWLNLEYLSAEDWVESHHGLPSPQPDLPLTKYFFFPGFTEATGGLIVEHDLARRRDAFQADAAALADFRRRLGLGDLAPDSNRLWVSLFCYDNAALPPLLDAWTASSAPLVCVVPEGRALDQLSNLLGLGLTAGARVELGQGALSIAPIPFLEQDDYDRLLWGSDVNFVRGEDSYVRAQFAARPLVWQAYPQADEAHLTKMSAFLARYTEGLEAGAAVSVSGMFDAWNRQAGAAAGDTGRAWADYRGQQTAIAVHARRWADRLTAGASLVERLVRFCENQLK